MARRNVRRPHEESVALTAGVEKTIEIRTPDEPGSLGVRYELLCIDEGLYATGSRGALQVRAKIAHEFRRDVMGSGFHTFGALAGEATSRNAIVLDYDVKPLDHLTLTLVSAANATVIVRVERVIVHDAASLPGGFDAGR